MVDWNQRTFSKEEFINAFNEATSIIDIARHLNLARSGGTYNSFNKIIKELNLDLDELNLRRHEASSKRAKIIAENRPTKTLEEKLVKNSTYGGNRFKEKLFASGLLERKCYKCGITTWNDQPAPLELEHINGDHADNRIENLTILCPNCHAQTSTYRGKNINLEARLRNKQRLKEKRKKEHPEWFCTVCANEIQHNNTTGLCRSCLLALRREKRLAKETRHRKHEAYDFKGVCSVCAKVISTQSTTGLCKPCYQAKRKAETERTGRYPAPEVLLAEVEASSWSAVGRKYGVSDNALRGYLRRRGLL